MPGHMFAFDIGDIKEREEKAKRVAEEAAIAQVAEINATNVLVRDLIPELDLDPGSDNGWTTNEKWEQTTMTDGSNNAYVIRTTGGTYNRALDKAIAIYGLTTVKSTPISTRIKFLKGLEGSGMGVKDYMDIEPSYNQDQLTMLFKDVILYEPGEDGHIQLVVDGAGTEEIILLGVTAEKSGENISLPAS